ncbi:KxDL motif-containing protein 1 [Holothuria leucospilota]|uniref:KxDL motif-containing protein 1 n=1 Tax=Holothuria leucospilota TaxID=206669 RepID=A0A9Q1BNY6_HOLLE|nr:KxDL motif-containing protein 1 [Holothuria leucospilota]
MSGKSHAASDAFLGSLTSMTNDEDMQGILDAQNHMLGRFEKTNEMLSNFNSLSSQRYDNVQQQFSAHTQLLLDMKADLDIIFRRLRTLKAKLARDYPRAFAAATKDERKPDLGEDEESLSNSKTDSLTGASEKSSSDGACAAEKVHHPENTIVDKDSSSGANVSKNSEPPVYLVD